MDFLTDRDPGDEQRDRRVEPNGYIHDRDCSQPFPYCCCNANGIEDHFDESFRGDHDIDASTTEED